MTTITTLAAPAMSLIINIDDSTILSSTAPAQEIVLRIPINLLEKLKDQLDQWDEGGCEGWKSEEAQELQSIVQEQIDAQTSIQSKG